MATIQYPNTKTVYIDIHTHHEKSQLDLVQVRSVNSVLTESSDFLENHDQRYFSLGIHPWSAETWNEADLQFLEKNLSQSNVLFLGEIGLDKACRVSFQKQILLFELQLELAANFSKPVILHMVRSAAETIAFKRRFLEIPTWIAHGYRGGPQGALQLLNAGFYLSFGPRFNAETIKACPFNRMFLETDTDLIPIETVYEHVAKIKGCEKSFLMQQLALNFEVVVKKKPLS